MRAFLESAWYGRGAGGALLAPLSWLYGLGVGLRARLYRRGLLHVARLSRPVIVVGNLTVGGTGKTPLVLWLVKELAARGLRPGVVSRGYGSKESRPRLVTPAMDAAQVGDEPRLVARRTGVPVAVGHDRAAAAALLTSEVDLVISDDGLQHYGLGRDLEILVLDGARGLGNGRLLPAGPLREDRRRLGAVDFVVVNGEGGPSGALHMRLVPSALVRLKDGRREALDDWRGRRVHAVAGIGHPRRFFSTLAAAGLEPIAHPFADHARFGGEELDFGDDLPVLMTEKDAVKCLSFAKPHYWYLEVEAKLPDADAAKLLSAALGLYALRRPTLRTLGVSDGH